MCLCVRVSLRTLKRSIILTESSVVVMVTLGASGHPCCHHNNGVPERARPPYRMSDAQNNTPAFQHPVTQSDLSTQLY